TVIGQASRIEVWDFARWQDYLASHEESYSEQSEEVIPGLF
ncbi:MAG: cell division/cell wall cluster transcriptional repressor MraZ, partial [Nostocoides sp.]